MRLLTHPRSLVVLFYSRLLSRFIHDDETYLKILWWLKKGTMLNLEEPKCFNEKLQWLKLHYHKPEFTMMVDKYAVKKYISDKLGSEYVIPLLGVWDRPEEVDFNSLPDRFVLKCNHTSGLGLVICKDKSKLNIPKARKALARGLKDDYFLRGREWPYRDVVRKIIAEEYKEDESGYELKDYKLYCFGGEPKFCQVDFGKGKGLNRSDFYRNIYDMEWNLLDIQYSHPNDPSVLIEKPSRFEKMKGLARTLSEGEPFMRVDFYNIGNQIFFSEITFYPIAGMGWFKPASLDQEIGSWIELPNMRNAVGGVNSQIRNSGCTIQKGGLPDVFDRKTKVYSERMDKTP